MKITLDQDTLAQAVRSHLRNSGVSAEVVRVDFRYNRSPFAVLAEVELSEARVQQAVRSSSRVVEKEIIAPAESSAPTPQVSIVDPNNLPPVEPEVATEEQLSGVPTAPLFGGG